MLRQWAKGLDWIIIGTVCILACFSILCVASATHAASHHSTYPVRQIMWFVIGFGCLIATVIIGDQAWKEHWKSLYLIGLFLVFAVLFVGTSINGARGWLNLKIFYFEPSEYMKLAIIVALSQYVSNFEDIQQEPFRRLVLPLAMTLVPFFLIMIEPELGMAIVLLVSAMGVLIIGGVHWRHLLILLLAGCCALATLVALYHWAPNVFFKFIHPYQLQRLLAFRDPKSHLADGSGYQTFEALIAVGSGQLWGEGFLKGIQTQGGFVPEESTDFIFSAVGEEWGFAGSLILILLYLILFYRMVRIGVYAKDTYGSCLVAGITVMLFTQVFENIGMNIGLMPVTGITLPLMSYGGSSILVTMTAIGLVLSVGKRQKRSMF